MTSPCSNGINCPVLICVESYVKLSDCPSCQTAANAYRGIVGHWRTSDTNAYRTHLVDAHNMGHIHLTESEVFATLDSIDLMDEYLAFEESARCRRCGSADVNYCPCTTGHAGY